MKPKFISQLYEKEETLLYHPQVSLIKKRTGFKKLIAYDDRFFEVTKNLASLTDSLPQKKIKVLDIGVGDAVYESMLPKKVKNKCLFYGVDISRKQIERAKKYLFEGKIVNLDSEKLPYPSNFFDIIIVSEILEHLFFPDKLLSDASKVLKSGGFMLLTYPNSGALQIRLSLLLTGKSVMINYPQNQQHIRFFTTEDIKNMLGNNYQLIKHKGLSSFLFDRWNFPFKIPMPRILEVIGNKYLKNFALGNLLLAQKLK